MPNRRRFEGRDLEALLDQVRSEAGPAATIVEANRVRSGGVFGFFAKEGYEVVVDEPPPLDSRPDLRFGGLDPDRRSAGLDPAGFPSASLPSSGLPSSGVPSSGLPSSGFPSSGFDPDATRPMPAPEPTAELPRSALERERTLAELADRVSDAERRGRDRRPVSTESPAFQAVLARMVDEAVPAPRRVADLVRESPLEEDEPPFEPWLVAGDVRTPGDEWTPTRPRPVPAPVAVAADPPPPAGLAGAEALRLARTSTLVAAAVAATGATRVPGTSPVLARLGLPAEIVEASCDAEPLVGLTRALDRLPSPPPLPRSPGAVVAVVGERAEALALAEALAEELGVDPDEVVLASSGYRGTRVAAERRLDGAAAAAERRQGWRRRPGPVVVAVDCPVGRATAWAGHVLTALEPAALWGTAPATRKPEDVRAWAERLGGLDALAVTDLDATESPAAVLQAGIPVARLERHPASAARWAAVLTDRLAGS